jgi:hypothetical protein
MRLRIATLSAATVALLVAGAAFGAGSTTVKRTMRATPHVASGGTLTMKVKRTSSTRFRVDMLLKTPVKSGTVLAFTAYPCGRPTCDKTARDTVRISGKPGVHTVTYQAKIARVTRDDGTACVFGQVVDLGPKRKESRVLKTRSGKLGLRYCEQK